MTTVREHAHLLDSEGLSQWVRGDRRTGLRIKKAERQGIRVMTTSMTMIEAYDPTRHKPAWQWALSRIHIEPAPEDLAKGAVELLKETGLHGHKYAIDAAVALRQPGPVTVFASDEDDMRELCGDRVVAVRLWSRDTRRAGCRPSPYRARYGDGRHPASFGAGRNGREPPGVTPRRRAGGFGVTAGCRPHRQDARRAGTAGVLRTAAGSALVHGPRSRRRERPGAARREWPRRALTGGPAVVDSPLPH
ncbi:hypothetical protein V1L54_25985 [Streptomyces sp. TRM 70361]|uniref:hypothetical protein n=1 Tax=Streptomyces sp. TRM 70361 TaxID=3116553 RepID=UPI002E7AB3FB|nr:hypothetical protein [Streptomyces sp. TRM 70361]MEE1942818.1 hypothetical protein [Streptomyces sp. TRM 70361]